MWQKIRNTSLAMQIIVAMVAGSIVGIIVGPVAANTQFIGDIWLNLIKMIVIPLIICVVVRGISSMDSPQMLGRVGSKIVIFYGFTTIVAGIIGVITTLILKPGVGFEFTNLSADESIQVGETLGFTEYITSLFSDNMFVSFYNGDMIQVLIISVFIGIAIIYLDDKYKVPVKDLFINMSELFMSLVNIIISLAPIGVFFLMASSLGQYGLDTFASIGKMLGTFYVASLIHVLIVYLGILWIVVKFPPIKFLKDSSSVWVMAASTCSSAATVPVTLKVAKEKFNVNEQISSFSIPFGTQFNQDGAAVLSSVFILFAAQALGVNMGIWEIAQLVLLATLISAGSGAIPGGGIVRISLIATAFGMPMELVGLVAAFYRLFDMGTTSMAVIGDLSATVLIDRLEKKRKKKTAAKASKASLGLTTDTTD